MKPNWFPTSETIMFNLYAVVIGLTIFLNQYRISLYLFVVGVMHALWTIAENTRKK